MSKNQGWKKTMFLFFFVLMVFNGFMGFFGFHIA